jgi:hypothetical protein
MLSWLFQSFWHADEAEGSKGCNEAGFFLILLRHPTLVISREAIQQRHNRSFSRRVHNLVHSWQCIVVFWCGLVEISEIDAHSPLAVLFLDRHRVGQPFGIHDFADDGGVKQPLNLLLDSYHLVIGHLS